MSHRVLYLSSVGGGGVDGVTAARKKDWLRNSKFGPDSSYEVALAGRQPQVFADVLTELGFSRKLRSINPNSGRPIEGWFKDATNV